MTLIPLPAFSDNYIWLLHDGKHALVVDPGDAKPVFAALAPLKLQLQAILVTHHHPDHTGGVAELALATGATVYGPAREAIPEPLHRLGGGDPLSALGLCFTVIDVPGHTAGHIAYFAQPPNDDPLLFCGDTLFSGGCGRLFEGSPAQMLASLRALAALPDATRICCAHEYTLANLRFASAADPHNAILADYQRSCQAKRLLQQPTLPSRLALEKQINPFLRWQQPALQQAALRFAPQAHDELAVFTALRQWKNEFQ